ncbi:hypothetical protein ACFLWA_06750 [Chloroflexota bacterium]
MIPVEVLWFALILAFACVGMVRGLAKELGTAAILMLTLFTLFVVWDEVIARVFGYEPAYGSLAPMAVTMTSYLGASNLLGVVAGAVYKGESSWIMAVYYGVTILFVGFIAYEGVVLAFPIKEMKGMVKGFFGFFGGLLNGYLIAGTLWNVVANADYFYPAVTLVSPPMSSFHQAAVELLPVSLMASTNPFVMLIPGMLLLLAIILT